MTRIEFEVDLPTLRRLKVLQRQGAFTTRAALLFWLIQWASTLDMGQKISENLP